MQSSPSIASAAAHSSGEQVHISPADALAIPAQETSDPARLNGQPLVSVLVITYNHERFLEATIDGILAQDVDFPVEILVGEDASTDRTRDVCQRLQAAHPDRIRVVMSDSNVGWQRNLLRIWFRARGQYLALCEGDDYWTDRFKLKKQVALLESNPDVALCGARASVMLERPDGSTEMLPEFGSRTGQRFSLQDLFGQHPFHTSTAFLRSGVVRFPTWFLDITNGDKAIYVLSRLHGDVVMMPDTVSVHRIHSGGMWSQESVTAQLDRIEHLFLCFASYFGGTTSKAIRQGLALSKWPYVRPLVLAGEVKSARRAYWLALKPALVHRTPRSVLINSLAVMFPSLYRMIAGHYADSRR